MDIVCLDLEGVLIPEIWIAVAERTGIEALKATTRDIPDYNVLMRQRLGILEEHGLTIGQVQKVIDGLAPLEGAKDFSDWLRSRYQLVILSDTFYEFAQPFMRQLGWPMLFCHRLLVDDSGNIIDYQLRMPDHKRSAVAAFKQLRGQLPSDAKNRSVFGRLALRPRSPSAPSVDHHFRKVECSFPRGAFPPRL